MREKPEPRRTPPADPERSSDPIPDGENIVAHTENRRDTTPRRYDQPADDDNEVMPADDSTLGTQI